MPSREEAQSSLHFAYRFSQAALFCEVREPHLLNVLANLRNFAARVPYKYRGSIEKACTAGLSFCVLRLQLKSPCCE